MFTHMLIATDGTEFSDKAVAQGVALAKALGARVTFVHVTEPWTSAVSGEWAIAFPVEEYVKTAAANAKVILRKAAQQATAGGVPFDTVHATDRFAAEGIIEEAEKNACDVIVMATHGRRGFARFLLGSQANRVLTHSTLPVLICK
jgi:nucleotide-binding universal stress UspA family protein